MAMSKNSPASNYREKTQVQCNSALGGAYGLALIGALVYYIQQATTFWIGVVGFLKALVWPAFLVYGLLKFLKM